MTRIRCLKTGGITLVDCKVTEQSVWVGMAFQEFPEYTGTFDFLDVDTGEYLALEMPTLLRSPTYGLEVMRERVEQVI